MKLSEAAKVYVRHRRLYGAKFENGEKDLRMLCRACGDIELSEVTALHFRPLLERSRSTSRARGLHALFFGFCEYWLSRNELALIPLPPKRAAQRSSFVPYIYSQEQLRNLLRVSRLISKVHPGTVSPQTLYAFFATMCGTGALLGEILSLKADGVDLNKGYMVLRSGRFARTRRIPLCKDLLQVLRKYANWKRKVGLYSVFFFSRMDQNGLQPRWTAYFFAKMRKHAGIQRTDGAVFQPRMQDIRVTFAVHRISAWIRTGADLNRMLPALAAYMGHAGLVATERYLNLVPERFRKSIDKLSPGRPRRKWRDDTELMQFLRAI